MRTAVATDFCEVRASNRGEMSQEFLELRHHSLPSTRPEDLAHAAGASRLVDRAINITHTSYDGSEGKW